MPKISFRLDFPGGERLGPGKVALLEAIERSGSIRRAAEAMEMSYRRAWLLVESVNRLVGTPAVETSQGGRDGGGTRLTPAGRELLCQYAAMARAVDRATATGRRAIARLTRRD